MSQQRIQQAIAQTLPLFLKDSLRNSAMRLFRLLGYGDEDSLGRGFAPVSSQWFNEVSQHIASPEFLFSLPANHGIDQQDAHTQDPQMQGEWEFWAIAMPTNCCRIQLATLARSIHPHPTAPRTILIQSSSKLSLLFLPSQQPNSIPPVLTPPALIPPALIPPALIPPAFTVRPVLMLKEMDLQSPHCMHVQILSQLARSQFKKLKTQKTLHQYWLKRFDMSRWQTQFCVAIAEAYSMAEDSAQWQQCILKAIATHLSAQLPSQLPLHQIITQSFTPLDRSQPLAEIEVALLQNYVFTVVENTATELEMALTPQILGAVFECLIGVTYIDFHRQKPQSLQQSLRQQVKQTIRKVTGTYYTPLQVVDYMVRRSLFVALLTKLRAEHKVRPDSRLELCLQQLVNGEKPELSESQRLQLNHLLQTLKILDPACGSGAFLVNVLHQVHQLLQQLQPASLSADAELALPELALPELALPELALPELALPELALPELALPELALQCIHGIDVQPMAIQITRFRCLLWLLVTQNQASEVSQAVSPQAVSPQAAAPQLIENHQYSKYLRQFELGDALLDHHRIESDRPLFDIVIGNPPYLDSEQMSRSQPDLRQRYVQHFQSAQGNWDLFILFMEWGLQQLQNGGVMTYLVPNKLLSAGYAQTLRSHLQQQHILEIRDYSEVQLFRNASVYPVMVAVQKKSPVSSLDVMQPDVMQDVMQLDVMQPDVMKRQAIAIHVMQDIVQSRIHHTIPAEIFYQDSDWTKYFLPPHVLNLLNHATKFPRLKTVFPEVLGASTVGEAYCLQPYLQDHAQVDRPDQLVKDLPFQKFVNTGTIQPYGTQWQDKPTRYLKQLYRAPIVLDQDLQTILPKRYQQAIAPKLIIAGMGKRLACFYDQGEFLAGKSTLIVLDQDRNRLKYLLALLNSRWVSFWYHTTYQSLALSNGYLRMGKREVQSIPIPDASMGQQQELVNLVEELLDRMDRKNAGKDGKDGRSLLKTIDDCVCHLYGVESSELTGLMGDE